MKREYLEKETARIDSLLLAWGIHVGDRSGRREFASAIVRRGGSGRIDNTLFGLLSDELKNQGWTASSMKIRELLEEEKWEAFADRVEEQLRKRTRVAPDEQSKGISSSIEFVSSTNPYGWRPGVEEAQRHMDHARPNTWNAFRQAYNGSRGEKVEGCTRWEVCGTDHKPTREWNREHVAAARMSGFSVRPGHVRHALDESDINTQPLYGQNES
jgi:hypothetical protein